MKFRTLTAAAGALAMTAVLAPTAHGVDDPGRIVGGSVSTQDPGAASLHVVIEGQVTFWCSASVLDANSILTAAHCVDQKEDHVRVGSLNKFSGGTKHRVSKVAAHPSTDLAVLTLATPIANPKTVRLATTNPSVGDTNTLYGWGGTTPSGTNDSPVLKQANVPVTNVSRGYITSGVGNGYAIFGDSGGPQFDRAGNQVGVCSGGHPGEDQSYVSVSDHLGWIKSNAGL
ncbi:S1 family peptidase [Demetria terragena]|uniref:S1 family peptidase n=1 Tax=Demetria terragena TaxID=63959 RepID=UPI0012E9975B|nr:trypsin-like serine protease [Demetria terragena]